MRYNKKHITGSYKQTQKLGENFALRFYSGQAKNKNRKGALVLGLNGDLGSGKTTFLQGFAKGLGIREKITSPTFVILKHFEILQKAKSYKLKAISYTDFYHIDCYRLQKPKELLDLGFKEIIQNPQNIVAIEWADKIRQILPKKTIFIEFKFNSKNARTIDISKYICYI